MPKFSLRFDMRGPSFGPSHQALYAAALDMTEYADRHGFVQVDLSEHHGVEDGYVPSPIVFAAAIAARTKRMRLSFKAIVAPLHDPVRLAEDIAILDVVSGGRVETTLVAGYVPYEFALFGKALKDRPAAIEESIRVMKAAWTGEPFDYRGGQFRVTPRPVQRPHPPLLMGGSSPAAARRAGRIADGFVTYRDDLYQIYFDAAKAAGKNPEPFSLPSPGFLYVAEDPDKAWAEIGPHALHEMNSYGRWIAETGSDGRFAVVESIDQLKATGAYLVVTPDECVAIARKFETVTLHPLMGGLPPEISWRGLSLFVEKVMPRLV